jgi:hypothetical protein
MYLANMPRDSVATDSTDVGTYEKNVWEPNSGINTPPIEILTKYDTARAKAPAANDFAKRSRNDGSILGYINGL